MATVDNDVATPEPSAARPSTPAISRPGKGYVLRGAPGWTWKANGRENQGRFDLLVADHVAFAAGPPLHVHVAQEDSFLVFEGVLTVQLDDEVFELGPGDFATAPPGVPHSFTNARADQPVCRVVNVMTPGSGFDRYLDQLRQLALPGDQEAIDRLNGSFGVTILGPSVAERLGLGVASAPCGPPG